MGAIRNWTAMLAGCLGFLTLILSATPARLSVSNQEAAVEGAAPGSRLTLLDGATAIGEAAVDPSGRARFGELHLSPGDHVLRVAEWGTGWGLVDPLTVHVAGDSPRAKGFTLTTITLSSSANPAFFGQPLTLRAVVSPSSATGAVTFYDGAEVLGTSSLTGGIASLTTTMPAFGTSPFKAYYAGSPVYLPSTSTPLSQTIRVAPQNGFDQAQTFKTPFSTSIAIGDFNHDGSPDLALADVAGKVTILLANPDPPAQPGRRAGIVFEAPVQYATGTSPTFVATGDFNGDGSLDLAVANGDSNNVSILLGNGDGTFRAAVNYKTGTDPVSIALADFDGDGILDLGVANLVGRSVTILLGNGDGTFRSFGTFPAGVNPKQVAAGDFNGDGKTDLAVSNAIGNTVSVLLGNGDGSFQPRVAYASGPGGSFAVGDVNGDGKADFIVANGPTSFVSVLLGRGDGTFQPPVTYNTGSTADSVAVGDFNGDGIADVAVIDFGRDQLTILSGNRAGTFEPSGVYVVGTKPRGIAVGELNGDGRSDLAVVNEEQSVSILLGIPTYLSSSVSLSASPNPSTLGHPVTLRASVTPPSATGSVAFYDGATVLGAGPVSLGRASLTTTLLDSGARHLQARYAGDLVYAASASASLPQTVTALPESGFQIPLTAAVGPTSSSLASGDFNGDGIPDLAVTNLMGDQVSILLGLGNGKFRAATHFAAGHLPVSVAVGDFNGDGKPDLAVIASQQNTGGGRREFGLNLLLGNGDGTFQPPIGFDTRPDPSFVVVADFDGDGKADLAIANHSEDTVSIMLGNGEGKFRTLLYHCGVNAPVYLAVGDFNGDGRPDLVAAGSGVTVSSGNGDGTFQLSFNVFIGVSYALAVEDFNGDGKLDLAILGHDLNSDNIIATVQMGKGDGTFLKPTGNSVVNGFISMAAGDFNGDGIPDLAVGEGNGTGLRSIRVLLGTGLNGAFQLSAQYHLVDSAAIVAGDFNGDGRTDLAAAGFGTQTVSVLLGIPATTQVTLHTSPSGLMIGVDGQLSTTPVTLVLTQGTHNIAAPTTQTGAPGTRFLFDRWSDGGTASHAIKVTADPITYTAVFGNQYLLTTASGPAGGGTVSVNPPSPALDGYYNLGTKVTVNASPAAGYSFSGFTGALMGTTNPQTLNMTAPAAVSASFTAIPPQNPTIFGSVVNKTTQGSMTTLTLVLTNTGAGPAQSVALTSLTAGVLTGTGSVSVASPAVPYSSGALQPGAAANVTVQLTVTGAVSRARLLFGGTMQNTAGSGLMFSGATQVTIP